jgi:hypothetical protein
MSPTALTARVGGLAGGGVSDTSSVATAGETVSVAVASDASPTARAGDAVPAASAAVSAAVAATVASTVPDVSAAGFAMPWVPVSRIMSVHAAAVVAAIATSRQVRRMGPPLGILPLRYHTAYSEETGKLAEDRRAHALLQRGAHDPDSPASRLASDADIYVYDNNSM